MKINKIIVLKETRAGEARVAFTPETTAYFVNKKYSILVEKNAGKLAGFSDQNYIDVGATVFEFDNFIFPENSLILRVKIPSKERQYLEKNRFRPDTIMLGFLDPLDREITPRITTISLELLDLTSDDPRNAQAAMSRFAGKLALQDALQRYQAALPKKVTVLGTGPAGLGAAFMARELNLPLQLFGRQERHRQSVEAAGIVYRILPATGKIEFIRKYLNDQTIVIAAARNVGERSPLLIDAASLAVLSEGSIVVDLSAGEGGCVAGSQQDQVVLTEKNISIVNISGYPKAEPRAASEAYSEAVFSLLNEIMDFNGEINLEDSLLNAAWVTDRGEVNKKLNLLSFDR